MLTLSYKVVIGNHRINPIAKISYWGVEQITLILDEKESFLPT